LLKHISILVCAMLFLSLSALAENPAAPAKDESPKESSEADDVTITAERMEMHIKDRYTELTGNVLVQDSAVNLTAEKIRVYTDEHNKLEKVEAEDHVVIRKLDGSESATGDQGLYEIKADTIILDGNCTLMQGNNILKCKRIVYDRKKQTISAEGGTLVLPSLRKKDLSLVPDEKTDDKKPSDETENAEPKSKNRGFLPFLDKPKGEDK